MNLARKVLVPILIALPLGLVGCASYQSLPIVVRSFMIPCDATFYYDVLWSPDGQHIAFLAARSGFAQQVFVMNPDGRQVRRISAQTNIKTSLEWSPDSTRLLYSADSGSSVYVVTLDGQETMISLPIPSLFNVSWSPDGERLLYGSTTSGSVWNADIYTIRLDGSDNTRLTDSADTEVAAQWSPDGEHIAYIIQGGSGGDTIMIMNPDGSASRRVTDGRQILGWSPDSQRLAYVKQGPNSFEVHVIRADGRDDTLVSSDFFGASWLPDSRHLNLVGTAPNSLLMIVDVDDPLKVEMLLTLSLADIAGPPSWSPDGKQVAFVAYDYSSPNAAVEEIYIMNRDFTGITPLTDNPGKQMCFNWPF